ncbi:MAG: CRISPR-associated protein Cmr2 [Symploca sp. SIO1B1]|nr:CRISPR-associated protein Cmr2 [Symploca sp. SIO1B1]
MSEYTAISFAPVQGFIEKSRKLRDLYGSSGILSYLSHQLINKAVEKLGKESIISPGLIDVQKGMPNRILLHGEFSRDEAKNTVLEAWQVVLNVCRKWIEKKVPAKEKYHWEQEWIRWGLYTWEIFWGHGEKPEAAMKDLENRKLRRDWVAINWMGESSSLTGTDAIAWPRLGLEDSNPGRRLTEAEQAELDDFYYRLSCVLENCPPDKEPEGKFLAPNERLSIPELVKRLVTREDIAQKLSITELEAGFTEIVRMPEKGIETGRWTGWFMGDGDKVGDKIKQISQTQGDAGIRTFSNAMRHWGENFMRDFPKDKGRVIYAGGDDFLGVLYTDKDSEPLKPLDALSVLMQLPQEWAKHKQDISLSVGFVWAGSSVPQRDILQHCREAEKQAKNLGRNRVTIRVVFNSGQYVQWTCPWKYLNILQKYCDRDGKTCGANPNWSHIYTDLAHLKARHAIPSRQTEESLDERIALELFGIYFKEQNFNHKKYLEDHASYLVGEDSPQAIINWISGLIYVGWQLCSNI